MALSPITPRDRLQRLADLGRKTLRYWWLIALSAVIGGALSLAFALVKPRTYQSWATLFYQERIQTQLLSPNREEIQLRNIGDKYRELLLARAQLEQIIGDPKLDPYPGESDLDVKIDQLRQAVKFESRGGSTFRIVYSDGNPGRAKAVTEKLTTLLQKKDESLRNELASATVAFAFAQKEEAVGELRQRDQELNEFLAKHPEFVADPTRTAGGAIRARTRKVTGNSELDKLEAFRQRVQARLDAPPDAPPVRVPAPPSAERIAAEAAVNEAQRGLNAANRALADALTKYTDRHPSVMKAKDEATAAQQELRRAQANLPPEVDTIISPATPQDREKLKRDLATIEAKIAALQKGGAAPVDNTTNWVVQLENQNAELQRRVGEARDRVDVLADGVFRAELDANQKQAEQGGRLAVVDPAFRPVRPSGPGKKIFLMAGMVLFLSLGFALAVGLAVIDDRLYRRADVEQLDVAVLAVIPPAIARARVKSDRTTRPTRPVRGAA